MPPKHSLGSDQSHQGKVRQNVRKSHHMFHLLYFKYKQGKTGHVNPTWWSTVPYLKVPLSLENLRCNVYRPLSHALQNPSNQMLIADVGSDTVHGNVKDAITCQLSEGETGYFQTCHPRDAMMPNDIK